MKAIPNSGVVLQDDDIFLGFLQHILDVSMKEEVMRLLLANSLGWRAVRGVGRLCALSLAGVLHDGE